MQTDSKISIYSFNHSNSNFSARTKEKVPNFDVPRTILSASALDQITNIGLQKRNINIETRYITIQTRQDVRHIFLEHQIQTASARRCID